VIDDVQLPDLDPESVKAAAERVLQEELYWLPVRHHSPAVARHVDHTIRARRPKVVFIEGPAECTPLVEHVIDKKTRPPVALYTSYRDDDNVLGLAGIASPSAAIPARFASWYPLVAYSPEYVAMKAASAVGAEVELIDLPHSALIHPLKRGERAEEPQPAPPEVQEDDGEESPEDLDLERGRDAEHLLVESRFYKALAEAAGFGNWNQAWDSLFEFSDLARDPEASRRELAVFCAASRATTAPERIAEDGTKERERHMWRAIRKGLKARKLRQKDAVVVCGGFHLFLDREDDAPPPDPPRGTVYTSVVPYSFFRISDLSGYGAGNRAPQFYQSVWELGPEGDLEDLLAKHAVAILKRARREGEAVSPADAISVAQHARMLAALRRRAAPILDDIHDAVVTCCCKGSLEDRGRYLLRAMDAVDIGSRIGTVTDALGRLPLFNDFYAQLNTLELAEVVEQEKRQTLRIDKREEQGRRQSAFLHRLLFLEIPLATLAEAGKPESGTVFREVWHLKWSPKIETELTEQSLYGDTVESASLARLREELARHGDSAGRIARALAEALDMDLPTLADEIERACGRAIGQDPRFISLSEAMAHLQVLQRHLAYRQRRSSLDALVEQCFDRACFSLPEAASAPENEQEAVVDGLRVLSEALLGNGGDRLDKDVLVQHVRDAAAASTVPFLRGAFLGMLAELRAVPPEDTARAVAAYAQAPRDRMVTAGEFLDGLLAACRTSLLLGAEHLVDAVDALLLAADQEAFLIMLPRMRAAFERLHERQRLTLADRVARRYDLKEGEELTTLATSVEAGVVMARLDEKTGRILAEWDL
jgi:hypothetical protein